MQAHAAEEGWQGRGPGNKQGAADRALGKHEKPAAAVASEELRVVLLRPDGLRGACTIAAHAQGHRPTVRPPASPSTRKIARVVTCCQLCIFVRLMAITYALAMLAMHPSRWAPRSFIQSQTMHSCSQTMYSAPKMRRMHPTAGCLWSTCQAATSRRRCAPTRAAASGRCQSACRGQRRCGDIYRRCRFQSCVKSSSSISRCWLGCELVCVQQHFSRYSLMSCNSNTSLLSIC